jgi:sialate O-acetylesterase
MIRHFRHLPILLPLLLVSPNVAHSEEAGKPKHAFSLPPVFSSNMILQRDVPVPVWGNAENGTVVTISWNGQNRTSTAQNGAWKVTLPPMPASAEPRVMSIQATGHDEIRLDNIVVGDVWLASGQSNMTMRLSEVTGGPEAIAASQNPLIRHYTVPRPEDAAKNLPPTWHQANPQTTPHQSAVGYFFVHELQQKLGIPVGLLHCSYGGTVTETWCGPDVMARRWPEWEAQQNRVRDNLKIHDRNKVPSYLHDRMLKTVMPFPVKGFLWYQGEGNAGRAREQTELFPAMVADWRKSWGNQNLPFFFVQLARYEASNWHNFRQAQLECWRKIPNSFMAVTIDLSKEPGNHPIHPKTKAPIGHRLALAARAMVYGETDLVHSGPVIRSMETQDGAAILSFDHIGTGLATLGGQPLRGFYLSADGATFVPGSATIVGNTVRVSSPNIASPVAVRYGAEDDMGKTTLDVNLGNKEALPASPFTVNISNPKP